MAEYIVTLTGVAGEPGPSMNIKVDKNGNVIRTLIPPPLDPTMGAAAVIIATQTEAPEQEE